MFCKTGSGTVVDLTQDTNTVYTHPSAKQCTWEPNLGTLRFQTIGTITYSGTAPDSSYRYYILNPNATVDITKVLFIYLKVVSRQSNCVIYTSTGTSGIFSFIASTLYSPIFMKQSDTGQTSPYYDGYFKSCNNVMLKINDNWYADVNYQQITCSITIEYRAILYTA